jgi:hypothetical protein
MSVTISITRPLGDPGTPASVVSQPVVGTGPGSGIICACGTVVSTELLLRQGFRGLIRVYALIYPGHGVQTAQDPISAGATQFVDTSSGTWFFPNLVGPDCTGSGLTPFTLKVWAVDALVTGVSVLDQTAREYFGQPAAQVDCTGCNGGSGPGLPPSPPPGPGSLGATIAMLLSVAPLQWALATGAFLSAAHAAFNGRWVLVLRQGMTGHCVWDNGGDGVVSPLVELRCEGPGFAVWQLNFRHGSVTLQYLKPADEWNGLGPNTFHAIAHAEELFPASLTLKPG